MSERLTDTDVIYQEGREELGLRGDKYELTTYLDNIGVDYSQRLSITYGMAGGSTRRLIEAFYEGHPRGIRPFSDSVGETYLVRVDFLQGPGDYQLKASWPNCHGSIAREYSYEIVEQADLCLGYFQDDKGLLSFVQINLPMIRGESASTDYCKLEGNRNYFRLGRRRMRQGEKGGGFYMADVTFEDLMEGEVGKIAIIEVPGNSVLFLPERVEITTKSAKDGVKAMRVVRQVGDKIASIEVGLPLSIDPIVSPPDLTDPRAIFQRMQEIKELLLRLKPVIT